MSKVHNDGCWEGCEYLRTQDDDDDEAIVVGGFDPRVAEQREDAVATAELARLRAENARSEQHTPRHIPRGVPADAGRRILAAAVRNPEKAWRMPLSTIHFALNELWCHACVKAAPAGGAVCENGTHTSDKESYESCVARRTWGISRAVLDSWITRYQKEGRGFDHRACVRELAELYPVGLP